MVQRRGASVAKSTRSSLRAKAELKPEVSDSDAGSSFREDTSESELDLEVDSTDTESFESSTTDVSVSEDEAEIRKIVQKTQAEATNLGLTARQRRLQNDQTPENSDENDPEPPLLSLPMTRPLTDEQMLRKSEKSRRRKMQQEAKLEETKRATIERLLTKQRGSTSTSNAPASAVDQNGSGTAIAGPSTFDIPSGFYRYIDRADSTLLLFPDQETQAAFYNQIK